MKRPVQCEIVACAVLVGLLLGFTRSAQCETRVPGVSINRVSRSKRLAIGAWGGKGIRLLVTAGGATVEYDCAHGTIARGILLDRRGRFDVSGTHVEERGGPVRQSEQLSGYPVRFTGRLNGKRLRLIVRNNATKEMLGIFTLVYGQEGELVKCR